jgi:hypothetical protein
MTTTVFNVAKKTDYNWATADIRVLVLGGASVPAGCHNPDLATVAAVLGISGANELNATNYTRKTSTRTDTTDNTNDRANQATSATITWAALGGAVNDTMRALLWYIEGANDAARIPLCLADLTATLTTNGSGVDLPAGDVMRTTG